MHTVNHSHRWLLLAVQTPVVDDSWSVDTTFAPIIIQNIIITIMDVHCQVFSTIRSMHTLTDSKPDQVMWLQPARNIRISITTPVLLIISEGDCMPLWKLRSLTRWQGMRMWAKEGNLWPRLLVIQHPTSGTDASKDRLLDVAQKLSALAHRGFSSDFDIDFDVWVGVDEYHSARWTGAKVQFDAVAMKRLLGV